MVHMACTIKAKADFFQLMPKHEETLVIIKQWLTRFFDLPSSTQDPRALGEVPIAPLAYSPASSKRGVDRGIVGSLQSRNLITSHFHVLTRPATYQPDVPTDLGLLSHQNGVETTSAPTSAKPAGNSFVLRLDTSFVTFPDSVQMSRVRMFSCLPTTSHR